MTAHILDVLDNRNSIIGFYALASGSPRLGISGGWHWGTHRTVQYIQQGPITRIKEKARCRNGSPMISRGDSLGLGLPAACCWFAAATNGCSLARVAAGALMG